MVGRVYDVTKGSAQTLTAITGEVDATDITIQYVDEDFQVGDSNIATTGGVRVSTGTTLKFLGGISDADAGGTINLYKAGSGTFKVAIIILD